jgi:hypothetical protein
MLSMTCVQEFKKNLSMIKGRPSTYLSGVGDSPRGPLKQWGKPHLKPAMKPRYVEPNHAGA